MKRETYDKFIPKNGRIQNARGYKDRKKKKRNVYGVLFLSGFLLGGTAVCFFMHGYYSRDTDGVKIADAQHNSDMQHEFATPYDIFSETGMGSGFGTAADTYDEEETGINESGSSILTDEEITDIQSGGTWQKIFENESAYPVDMINALKRNPEICDFVAGYLTADIDAAGSITSEESEEECPLFLQWDKRWGYVPYGQSNIGISGCGPACLSMVLYSLTRDKSLTPDALAKQAMEGGYYVAGQGTSWAFMSEVAWQYGVFVIQDGKWDKNMMETYLDDGKLLICAMGPGDFTDTGHFIVIRGCSDGKFFVNDPFSRTNSNQAWDYDVIASQCRQMWAYELMR